MRYALYVGDDPSAVITTLDGYNHRNLRQKSPRELWAVDDVPVAGFARATPDGLRRWLKGEVAEWQPRRSYDAIVVDYLWRDLVPVIMEAHPKTPAVMLLAPPGEQVEGIDFMLRGLSIFRLPRTLEWLTISKGQ